MRLLAALTVSLVAATASADPGPLPFEVIRVMANTQQVLVYDRAHNTHVLLAPGTTFEDYAVIEVSGIGLVVEKDKERFTVYPRAAKGLALELEPNKNALPQIYSTTNPVPSPAQVAAASPIAAPAPVTAPTKGAAPRIAARSTDAKTRIAADLASLLSTDTNVRKSGWSSSARAKLKP